MAMPCFKLCKPNSKIALDLPCLKLTKEQCTLKSHDRQ